MRRFRLLIAVFASSFVCSIVAADSTGSATYDLAIKIKKRDETSAAGLHVKICEVLISNKLVTKFEGDLPADGTIHLTGLRGGKSRPVHRMYAGPNLEQIDTFRFEGAEVPAAYEVTLPLMAGEPAPDGELLNLLTGDKKKLSDYRGQIIYLDFWGTWCVPCRQAMLRNEDAMKRRAKEWEGKAAILALSVDEDPALAKQYAIDRGWTNVIQVWNGEGDKVGWESPIRAAFGLDDIPRAVLIGKDGTILWRGDPNQVDPEKLIDEHLK
jgi:thiol-disulfide isomerase/thioredoxin